MKKIVEVKSLAKNYDKKIVLKNINFNLSAGEFCILLGENGAGKSTLLKILMGSEFSDRGEIKLFDLDPGKHPDIINQKIGIISESFSIDLPITIKDFFPYFASIYKNFDTDFFKKLCRERKFDINKNFKNYSRGQKMQLALMLYLSIQPEVLLIDEVTSVLDVYARKYFMSLINKFVKNGGTVIMTTNIISEVQTYATHLLLLKNGRLAINSSIQEISNKFVKIRRKKEDIHDVFLDRDCYWAGDNSDGSISYIIPTTLLSRYKIPESFQDRRSVLIDDIFIYFFNAENLEIGNDIEVIDDQAA